MDNNVLGKALLLIILITTGCAAIVGDPDSGTDTKVVVIIDNDVVMVVESDGNSSNNDTGKDTNKIIDNKLSICSNLGPLISDGSVFTCNNFCQALLGKSCSSTCKNPITLALGVAGIVYCSADNSPNLQCGAPYYSFLNSCDDAISCIDTGNYTNDPYAQCCCQ